MIGKISNTIKKWKVFILLAPLYIFIGMGAYWSILDRDPPVILKSVDYTPTTFLENDHYKKLFITYNIIRTRECSVSSSRYLVSISRPKEVYYIGSIPQREITEDIGVPISVHFDVLLPEKLPPGDYNYYALSSYSCKYNPIQKIFPLKVQTPMLPVTIQKSPKFSN